MLQVKIWFQNRRMKWRNSKERELLAAGGSREQTLPNKNNPHPDLSDAEADRAKLELSLDGGDEDALGAPGPGQPRTPSSPPPGPGGPGGPRASPHDLSEPGRPPDTEESAAEDEDDDEEEINVT